MSDPRSRPEPNAKGQLISMPATNGAPAESSPATVTGDAIHDGLDSLFMATRQVEAAVHQERAHKDKVQQELQALRHRYSQDMAKSQAAIRELASRQEELRTQLSHIQQQKAALEEKSRAMAERIVLLQAELAQKSKESAETTSKLRTELEQTRTALARSQEQSGQIERVLTVLRPEFEALKQENELAQTEASERERKYKAALQSYDAYQKNILSQLASARDELTRAKGEIHHLREARGAAEESKRQLQAYAARVAELQRQLDRAGAANQALNTGLQQEKQRRNEFARAAQGHQEERDSLRSQLGLAEHRLADAETRISDLSEQLALLRAERIRVEVREREAQNAALAAAPPIPEPPAMMPPPPPPAARAPAMSTATAAERQSAGATSAGPAIPEFLIRAAGAALDGIEDDALVGYPIEQ